jgi:aminoglycoside phosphotransferase (APT) family kinase protein
LVHGDFHAGNVIVAASGAPTIIDWSDGALAHPFFDPFILFQAERTPLDSALRAAMLDTYFSAWHRAGFGSLRELQRTFELAQRLAPLYHAASYRRVVAIGLGAARDFAHAFGWLLGLLSQAHA